MTQHHPGHGHAHPDGFGTGHGHDHEVGLADLLDLDAEVLGSYLDEVTAWAEQHAPQSPRRVVDLGAGTGAGSLALARRFAAAEVVAVDRSAVMLERLQAGAREHGLADRVRAVEADVDTAWPAIAAVDLAWTSSSLHEVADPDRLLRQVYAALTPGGSLVVVEMDALPRLLPDDIGLGRPGLESRCHDALAELSWNSHPDWRPHLEQAGFDVVAQRSFSIEPSPTPTRAGSYAHAYLRRIRTALDGRLAPDDVDTLDRLLAHGTPDALLRRTDLTVRGTRTAWAARRPRTVPDEGASA